MLGWCLWYPFFVQAADCLPTAHPPSTPPTSLPFSPLFDLQKPTFCFSICKTGCLICTGIPPVSMHRIIWCADGCFRTKLYIIDTHRSAKSTSTNQNQSVSNFSDKEKLLFGCLVTAHAACLQFSGKPSIFSGCISYSATPCAESKS